MQVIQSKPVPRTFPKAISKLFSFSQSNSDSKIVRRSAQIPCQNCLVFKGQSCPILVKFGLKIVRFSKATSARLSKTIRSIFTDKFSIPTLNSEVARFESFRLKIDPNHSPVPAQIRPIFTVKSGLKSGPF